MINHSHTYTIILNSIRNYDILCFVFNHQSNATPAFNKRDNLILHNNQFSYQNKEIDEDYWDYFQIKIN